MLPGRSRWSAVLVLAAVLGLPACKESFEGREWSVCNTHPCMVGYVCIAHRCVKGDGGEDPSTRYPGWDADGGAGDGGGAGQDGSVPRDDAKRLDGPGTCGTDSDCSASDRKSVV